MSFSQDMPDFLKKYMNDGTLPALYRHDPHCTRKGMPHSDAARRVSDTLNMHWSAALAMANWDGIIGRWVAFSLSDGTGGMQLYDSKRDAVRHQSDENLFFYLCLVPGGMGICEAELQIRTYR